jgi:hypothetical protein
MDFAVGDFATAGAICPFFILNRSPPHLIWCDDEPQLLAQQFIADAPDPDSPGHH